MNEGNGKLERDRRDFMQHILAIDDDEDICKLIQQALS